MNQRVSIIIPSYNCGNLLAECIESCLAQTYDNLEIIVVNDGSQDNTNLVAQKYAHKITYIEQENKGVAYSRNRGVLSSQGHWLLFLDADDVLYPEALDALLQHTGTSEAGVVFGITRQQKNGELRRRYNKNIEGAPPVPAQGNFLKSMIVTPGAAIVRREIFDKVNGFKLTLAPTEDRHFWLKCGMLTSFKACDTDIVLKRQQETSASNDINRMIYKGLLTQLDFVTWCYENQLDCSCIPFSESEIYELNLQRAIVENGWAALKAILLHARFNSVSSKGITRYSRTGCCYPFFWIQNLYSRFAGQAVTRTPFLPRSS